MIPREDFRDYTNLPYFPGGRSREGIDCVGLVELFLKEQFGYSGGAPGRSDYERFQCELLASAPPPLEGLERGDLLLFSKCEGQINHAAVYLGFGKILTAAIGRSRIDNGTELLRRVGLRYVAAVKREDIDRVAETLSLPGVKDATQIITSLVLLAIGTGVSFALRPKTPNLSRLGRYGESSQPLQTQVTTEAPLPDLLGSLHLAGNAVYQSPIDKTLGIDDLTDQRVNRVIVFSNGPIIGFSDLRVNSIPSHSKVYSGDGVTDAGFQSSPATVATAVDGLLPPLSGLWSSYHPYTGQPDVTVPLDIRASYDRDFPVYGFAGCAYIVFRFCDTTKFQSGLNASVFTVGHTVRTFNSSGFITASVSGESLPGANGKKVRFKLAQSDIKAITAITVNGVGYTELTATNQSGNIYHLNKTKGYVEFITAPVADATILVSYIYYVRSVSSKPAEHLVYLLTEKWRGKGLDESKINWPSFADLQTYCQEAVTWNSGSRGPVTTERFNTNYVLDQRKPLSEHIKALLEACHANLFLSGGKFSVKARKAGASVFSFNDANILVEKGPNVDRATFSSQMIDRADRSNRVHVFYRGAETFNAQTGVARDDSVSQAERALRVGNDGVAEEFLQYTAITDEGQAERLAETILAEEVQTRWIVELKTNIKGLALEPGDLVDVTHSSQPNWSAKLFRIEEINLDENGYISIKAVEYVESAYV